jgi:hypothetical protein
VLDAVGQADVWVDIRVDPDKVEATEEFAPCQIKSRGCEGTGELTRSIWPVLVKVKVPCHEGGKGVVNLTKVAKDLDLAGFFVYTSSGKVAVEKLEWGKASQVVQRDVATSLDIASFTPYFDRFWSVELTELLWLNDGGPSSIDTTVTVMINPTTKGTNCWTQGALRSHRKPRFLEKEDERGTQHGGDGRSDVVMPDIAGLGGFVVGEGVAVERGKAEARGNAAEGR